LQVEGRRIEPGLGVVGEVRDRAGVAVSVAVGERALVEKSLVPETNTGKTVSVFVAGELAATIELQENWRDGLAETFVALRELGIVAEVLSGDPQATVALGNVVSVQAGLTPAQKLARVEEQVGRGRTVLFVGDGLNDAAAMSAAQASVAMRSGADLARASAMAVFVGHDLRFLPRAIWLARAARRSIKINLMFAAGYNLVGMTLAAAGLLHPIAAALLMLGSSVFVSINALRTGRDLTNVGR